MTLLGGSGNNPTFGRDPGPPPPFAGITTGAPPPPDLGPPPPGTSRTVQAPYYHHPMTMPGMPAHGVWMPPGVSITVPVAAGMGMSYYYPPGPAASHPVMIYGSPCYPPPPYTPSSGVAGGPQTQLQQQAQQQTAGYGAAVAVDAQGVAYQYVSGLAGSGRFPGPAPAVDPDFPAANHVNGTGGAGVEPGFNYFFPTEHARVIVLKCPVPPWTLAAGTYARLPFHAAKVPAGVTMAELLVGFGADNPDKARNQLWEVYPQGGGRWGWKEHCRGDDDVMMARTVRDMGWVEKRDGEVQTVYLWISKA
ncbi:hypothetical protein VTH06DRAFT_5357 [Thermothelomyces fergusii]